MSYKILQLNVYSNVLALYATYLIDQEVHKVYQEQSELFEKLYQGLKKQSLVLGNIPREDLEMSNASLQEAKMRLSKLKSLLMEERAEFRSALALPLNVEFKFEEIFVQESIYEHKTPLEIVERSLAFSPEMMQLNYLIEAAKSDRFAKIFGFMNSATISNLPLNSSSPFDTLRASGGFSISAENIVNVKISNNNLNEIFLRKEQLKIEHEKMAEIIEGKLDESKLQLQFSQGALESRNKVFFGQKRQYDLGLISLQTLLLTESQLTEAKINLLRNSLDLNQLRITLARLTIEGEFSKVRGCSFSEQPKTKKGFLGLKKNKISLDELCKESI